ncbi:MAG: leucine-rich alpha-2-glycoprotein [Candidatus Dependentiae bacterium]|nr:leucine-rich alpha-2-glycoprotein [Candidatus Dependentiae bacterium]
MVVSPAVTANIRRLAWSLSFVFLLHLSLSASTTATSRGVGESKESEAVASDFGQRLVAFHIKAVVPVESNPQCPGRYPVHMCTEADTEAVLEALRAARYIISPYGSSYFNSRVEYIVTPPIFPAEDPEAFYAQVADSIRTALNARHSAERGVVSIESPLDGSGRRPRPMQAYIPGIQYARYLARRPVDGIGELPAGIPVDVLSIVMAAGDAEPAEREAMLRAAVNHSSARVHIEEFLRHVAARPDLFRGGIGETAAYMALLAAETMTPEQVREHLGWTRRIALVRGWMASAAAQYNDVEGREPNEAFVELGAPSSKSRRGSNASSEASEIDSVVSGMSDVGSVDSRRSSRSRRSEAPSVRSHRDVPMVEAAAQRLDPIAESGEAEIAEAQRESFTLADEFKEGPPVERPFGAHRVIPLTDSETAKNILYMEKCNQSYIKEKIIEASDMRFDDVHMIIAHKCIIESDIKLFLSKLPNLEFLCLNACFLTWLPSRLLENNRALKVLILSNNSISAIPRGFFSHTASLVWLDLSGNALTHIAEDSGVDALPELKYLSLAYNNDLEELPKTFLLNTRGLRVLNIVGCGSLEKVPDFFVISTLKSLVLLYISGSENLASFLQERLRTGPSLLTSFPTSGAVSWYSMKDEEMAEVFIAFLHERLRTVMKKDGYLFGLEWEKPFQLAEKAFLERHGSHTGVSRSALRDHLSSYAGVKEIMMQSYRLSEAEKPQNHLHLPLLLEPDALNILLSSWNPISWVAASPTLVDRYCLDGEMRRSQEESSRRIEAERIAENEAKVALRATCARALIALFIFTQKRFEALSKYCLLVGLHERVLSEAEYCSIYANPAIVCTVYELFCNTRMLVLSEEDKQVLAVLSSADFADDNIAFFSGDARAAWQQMHKDHVFLDQVFTSAFKQLYTKVEDRWNVDREVVSGGDEKPQDSRILSIVKISMAFLTTLGKFRSDTFYHEPFVEAKKAYASMLNAVNACHNLGTRIHNSPPLVPKKL